MSNPVQVFWAKRCSQVLLLGLLVFYGGVSFLDRAGALHGEDGVLWTDGVSGVEALRVVPGGPGDRAGIQRGDRLLSVDGVIVTGARQVPDLLWGRGEVQTSYRFFRGEAGQEKLVIPALSGEENRIFYYLCVVGLMGLGAGCLVAWRLPAEPAADLFFLLTVSFYLILVFSPSGLGGPLDWTLYWGDLAGRLLAPPLLMHFILKVAEEAENRRTSRRWAAVLYLPAAALLGWNLYLIPLEGALTFPDPVRVVALKDRLEVFYLAIGWVTAVAMLLIRLWVATRARVRWRLRWLALTGAAGLLPLVLLYLIPIALGIPVGATGELSIFPLGLVPLGFAAALFQDRTVDLDRSLKVAAQAAVGGALLLGAGSALSWSLSYLPVGRREAGILIEVILPLAGSLLLLLLLRPRLGAFVEAILGRPRPDVTRALLGFRPVLNGEIRLEILSRNFVERLRRVLRLDPVALLVRKGLTGEFRPAPAENGSNGSTLPVVFLGDSTIEDLVAREMILLTEETERLDGGGLTAYLQSGSRYLFPMPVQGDLKALLLVGPHRDGSPLGSDELEVLAALATQAARSVDGARLYGEIEVRVAEERRLRAQSQGVLEATRIGIVLADGRGRVTAANRAAGEILRRQDLPGEMLERLLPRGLLLLLDRRSRNGAGPENEGRVYHYPLGALDGRNRLVNVTRAPLSRDGESDQVYTLDDVTEEADREKRMLRQEHLASVGLLASNVAHEVNTPLTGIASYAQILMSKIPSRLPEMELLRKIEAQAFRAAGIVGSVLSLARRREGEAPRTFEPGSVVEECLTLFEPHLKGKRIRIVTDLTGSLPLVRGHRGRVQQLVMNLLLNATHASPDGGEVRLELGSEAGFLKLRVSDTGVGIEAQTLPRIFDPFFSTKPAGEGTGLGLTVVRQIIDEHGGRIHVDSTPGLGTTFTILLPEEPEAEGKVAGGA